MSLAIDGWALGMEASAVVGLRVTKLLGGGTEAACEAQRMIEEKLDAAIGIQMLALTGGLGATPMSATAESLRHYGRKVRANRRRLSR